MPDSNGSANGGAPSNGPSSPSASTASLGIPPQGAKPSLMRTLGSRVFRGATSPLESTRRDSLDVTNADRKMSVSSFPGNQTITGIPPKVNGITPSFNGPTVGVKPSPLKPVPNDDLPPSLKTGLNATWSPSSTQLDKLKEAASVVANTLPVQTRPSRFPNYPGYRIVKKLDETVNCTVYRGVRYGDSSNRPVILKVGSVIVATLSVLQLTLEPTWHALCAPTGVRQTLPSNRRRPALPQRILPPRAVFPHPRRRLRRRPRTLCKRRHGHGPGRHWRELNLAVPPATRLREPGEHVESDYRRR